MVAFRRFEKGLIKFAFALFEFFLLGDAEEDEVGADALAGALASGFDDLVGVGLDLVVAHAAGLGFGDDVFENRAGLDGDSLLGEFAGEKAEELLHSSVALGDIELVVGGFLLALADFLFERLKSRAGFDFGGEGAIKDKEDAAQAAAEAAAQAPVSAADTLASLIAFAKNLQKAKELEQQKKEEAQAAAARRARDEEDEARQARLKAQQEKSRLRREDEAKECEDEERRQREAAAANAAKEQAVSAANAEKESAFDTAVPVNVAFTYSPAQ